MIVRIDPATAFVRYELADPGPTRGRSLGWHSRSGLHVRFRTHDDFQLSSISFQAALPDFAGVDLHETMLRGQRVEQGDRTPEPGVAEVTNYRQWYRNNSCFVMEVDENRDEGRLVLRRDGRKCDVTLAEHVTSHEGELPITFEWEGARLSALRFRSMTRLLGVRVIATCARASSGTWPQLPI